MSDKIRQILNEFLLKQKKLNEIGGANAEEFEKLQKHFKLFTSPPSEDLAWFEQSAQRGVDIDAPRIDLDQFVNDLENFVSQDSYWQNLRATKPVSAFATSEDIQWINDMGYNDDLYKNFCRTKKDFFKLVSEVKVYKGSGTDYQPMLTEDQIVAIINQQMAVEKRFVDKLNKGITEKERAGQRVEADKLRQLSIKRAGYYGELSGLKEKILKIINYKKPAKADKLRQLSIGLSGLKEKILKIINYKKPGGFSVVGGMIGHSLVSGIINDSVSRAERYDFRRSSDPETGPWVQVVYPDPLAESKQFFSGFLVTAAMLQLARTSPVIAGALTTASTRVWPVALAAGAFVGLGHLADLRQKNIAAKHAQQENMAKIAQTKIYQHLYGDEAVYHHGGMGHVVSQQYIVKPSDEKMAIIQQYAVPGSISHTFVNANGHRLLLSSIPDSRVMLPVKTFVAGYWTSGEKEYKALPSLVPVDWQHLHSTGHVVAKQPNLLANLTPESRYALAVK